ncbi:hypothetical protein CBM2605_B100076 [Cupriavidus neocaledonicus]|uniref:Uncharacterized protein n=1 Tax=Cupriavidus neocaledonicus TaxID=1040979 RepID=A0ABY1V971_9BURK|nr:hypothetical protein CBM2605_B100076 [Cupriavidus neocaledonicus]
MVSCVLRHWFGRCFAMSLDARWSKYDLSLRGAFILVFSGFSLRREVERIGIQYEIGVSGELRSRPHSSYVMASRVQRLGNLERT